MSIKTIVEKNNSYLVLNNKQASAWNGMSETEQDRYFAENAKSR